jgi:DNA-binding response OmpR family regulator
MKLLFAEDKPSYRDYVLEILAKFDFEVFVAEDGQQAMDLLNEYDFDVVFTDNYMPHHKGVEVAEKAKELGISEIYINTSAPDHIIDCGFKVFDKLYEPDLSRFFSSFS